MVTRGNLLLGARRAALLNQGLTTLPTRRQTLLKRMGVAKRLPTQFYNKKGRQFFLTLKGKYVVRHNGKSLYGRKCTNPVAPLAIRPKRISGRRATKTV
jgi:hypothetical protein